MSECKHEEIMTWWLEDGEPAGLWSCADCNIKFAPMAATFKAGMLEAALITSPAHSPPCHPSECSSCRISLYLTTAIRAKAEEK